jgi:DHA1 family tetracycline resistance protein-like MFS transporter
MRKGSGSPDRPKRESTPERREMHTKLGWLMIAVLIDLIGFSIVIPLIPAYIAGGLHEGPVAAATDSRIGWYGGLLISVYAFMQFIFAPIWGRLSDRVGRKPIIIASLIGDAVFYAVFAFATHSLALQFASRILAGIFSSASLSVAQAYVADVTPPEDRATGLGMLGAVFGVGFIFGPALGGWLGSYNLAFPLLFASAAAIINTIFVIKVLPESRTPQARANKPAAQVSILARLSMMTSGLSGPVGFLYILTFLITFAFANLEGTFTAYVIQHFHYTKETSVGVAGYVFAYIGIIIVIVQGGLIRPLVKRYGEANLMLAGVFLMAVGFLLFPLPNKLIWLMLGPMLPISFGNGLNSPSVRALISRMTSADNQGQSLGLSSSFDSLARAIGPACGGFFYFEYGQGSPYIVAGLTMCFAFVAAFAQRAKLEQARLAGPQAAERAPETAA